MQRKPSGGQIWWSRLFWVKEPVKSLDTVHAIGKGNVFNFVSSQESSFAVIIFLFITVRRLEVQQILGFMC